MVSLVKKCIRPTARFNILPQVVQHGYLLFLSLIVDAPDVGAESSRQYKTTTWMGLNIVAILF